MTYLLDTLRESYRWHLRNALRAFLAGDFRVARMRLHRASQLRHLARVEKREWVTAKRLEASEGFLIVHPEEPSV